MKRVEVTGPDAGSRVQLRRVQIASRAESLVETLTTRERQVLLGLVDGLSNKGIARALNISPRTVEIHRGHLMRKIGAKSVADAVRIGLYAGLDEGLAVEHLSQVA